MFHVRYPISLSHLCFMVYYGLLCFCHCIKFLCIHALIYLAPQLQGCLINLLTYLLTYVLWWLGGLVVRMSDSRLAVEGQWRREGVCRRGQTSVLPPPANQISSAIRVGLFSGFRTWWCEPTFFDALLFPPSHHSLLPLSPSHSPFPTLFLPSLEVGSAVSSRSGSGAEPQQKLTFVHFNLKTWQLIATNLKTFKENQMLQFYAEFGNAWI